MDDPKKLLSKLGYDSSLDDILAENGSVHIESLCKWGPSVFVNRKRVKPSGRPAEKTKTIIMDDPTWKNELNYFKMHL